MEWGFIKQEHKMSEEIQEEFEREIHMRKKGCFKSFSLIILSFLLAASTYPISAQASTVGIETEKNDFGIEERLTLEEIPSEDTEVIDEAVETSSVDGGKAAELINEYADEDEEIFEVAVKEVLDTYYEKDEISKDMEDFSENIDSKATEILDNYEEAHEERINEENLDYVTKEIIVTLNEDVSKDVVEKLVGNLSESYEFIIEDEFEIDEDLNQRRKERLKAFQENYRAKTSIVVELGLDQSTDRAIEQFEEYGFVTGAEKNYYAEEESVSTNDPYLSSQWYLDKINTEKAWDSVSTAGCYDIWVAVVDSAVLKGKNNSHK